MVIGSYVIRMGSSDCLGILINLEMQMRLEVDDGGIRNARGTGAYTRIGGRQRERAVENCLVL